MMIKICFIVTDAVSFNFLMKGQLEFLSDLGRYDISLVSGGDSVDIAELKNRGVGKFHFIPFKRKPGFSDFTSLIKLFWFLLFNRQDVIVYSTPKAMLLGSLASFLSVHKKRVCIIRGRAYENFKGVKRKLFEALDFLSLTLSSKSLFISKSLMDEYAKSGLLKLSNYKVVGNGSSNGLNERWLDECFVSPTEEEINNKVGVDKERDLVVLTVGRLCRDKGVGELEVVVNYFSSFNFVKFISVGKVEDEFSCDIVEKLKALGNYTHFEQAKDIRGFYKASDLHLFLTHREGFGNVAIEAAGFNVPTLAFDVVGVRDSVCNGISGRLFNFLDTDSIIQCISYYSNCKDQVGLDFPQIKGWALRNYNNKLVWDCYEREYSS